MGFWSGYWKSLKPLDVEEPIDVWVHRPLAYVIARGLLPTPVSPNAVTLTSIVFGLVAGASILIPFEGHMMVAGAALFFSAVLDCADGQLARLRGTSSAFGRMLDGVADVVVIGAAAGGAAWHIWQGSQGDAPLMRAALAAGIVATIVTGSFHTTMYDHYKNVFLRMTVPGSAEGEDYGTALERYRTRDDRGFVLRIVWHVYLFYVKSQCDYVRRFDPFTADRITRLPPYDMDRARAYRVHAAGAMRVWRSAFGVGSLVFGIAAATFFDVLEWYLLGRLVVLNALFYGYLRPAQRRASRDGFRAAGVDLAEIGARV